MSAPNETAQDAGRAILEARDIRLSYPAARKAQPREVLGGVSLALAEGESLALVGESGSGKSSLARVLLQLVPPTAGEVMLVGESLTAAWRRRRGRLVLPRGPVPWRRRLQMVFQNAEGSLDGRLSVGDILTEPLEIFNEGTARSRREQAHALLEEVGLSPDLATRRPHELSGGQCQRVAIARALALGPVVLVADEPTSALDVTLKGQILRLFAQLQKSRRLALVLISHDLGAVAALCTRTLVMQQGRIVEAGPTRTLLGAPKHPYTQALIAAVPRLAPPRTPRAAPLG